jgi:hypothetical protein
MYVYVYIHKYLHTYTHMQRVHALYTYIHTHAKIACVQ